MSLKAVANSGGGSGGVTSFTSPNSSLTVSGTTTLTADINLAHANAFTAQQDFKGGFTAENGGGLTIDATNGWLTNGAGNYAVQWINYFLVGSANKTVYDWFHGQQFDAAGNVSIDQFNRWLRDSFAHVTIDYGNSCLYAGSQPIFAWGGSDYGSAPYYLDSTNSYNLTGSGAALTNINVNNLSVGVPQIVGNARMTALTAAQALAAYTVGASDTTFQVSANINITASTAFSFTVTCTYTDETNTSRTLVMNFSQISGTLVQTLTNVLGTGAYEGVPLHIRAKASTSITIASTGTFTTVTYNLEERILKL